MAFPHMVHGNQSLRTSHPQLCCCCSISSHPENSGYFSMETGIHCKAAGKVEVSERNRSPASPGGIAVSVSFDTRLHLQQAGPLLGSSTSVEGRCPSCTLLFNTDGGHPSHQTSVLVVLTTQPHQCSYRGQLPPTASTFLGASWLTWSRISRRSNSITCPGLNTQSYIERGLRSF